MSTHDRQLLGTAGGPDGPGDGLGQTNVAFADANVVIFERLPAPQAAPA